MQRIVKLSLALIALVWAGSATAAPVNVTDTYIGGDDHGHGDVIGPSSRYDVDRAELDQNGSILTVDIFTSFAGRADEGFAADYTDTPYGQDRGIGYGDLFLSALWTPDGAAPYMTDDHASGTLWTFGVVLDDRWSDVGGAATLYALGGADNDANVLLSDDFMSDATYRNGQAVAVDILSAEVTALANAATWSVEDGYLSFDIDIAGTGLSLWDGIAVHWGPTCANDIIEGLATQVPEPGTALLLGLGLIGAACGRRKRT